MGRRRLRLDRVGEPGELWAPGARVRLHGEDIVDVHRHGGAWFVAWTDRLACYASDGGERWRVRIGAPMHGGQALAVGDGCVWVLHDQTLVGFDLATGATVAGASFTSHRTVAGVLEIEGGIVIELDREVWWCDRRGVRALFEALSLGRERASNRRHAISVDAEGWFVRMFAPGGRWSIWQLAEQTRGMVLGDDALHLGAHDPIHVPLAAFDGDEIAVGGTVRLRRVTEPAPPQRPATSIARVLARAGVLATSDEAVLAEAVRELLDADDRFDLWSLCHGVAARAGHAAAVRILDAAHARTLDEELCDDGGSERLYVVPAPRRHDDGRALCLLLPYATVGLRCPRRPRGRRRRSPRPSSSPTSRPARASSL